MFHLSSRIFRPRGGSVRGSHMFDWLVAIFNRLATMFNIFNIFAPEPPPPPETDIGFQVLGSHMGNILLLLIYIMLHIGTNYLPVFVEVSSFSVNRKCIINIINIECS